PYNVVKSNVIIKSLQILEKEGFNIPSNVVELKKFNDALQIAEISEDDKSRSKKEKPEKQR
ncbi:MAG TPA: hypothetical protein VGB43_06875, partial [Flavobacterium sp.]